VPPLIEFWCSSGSLKQRSVNALNLKKLGVEPAPIRF
jgi:hypothetical protein